MTYTPKQIESMSDNEKILAVAIKAGIKHDVCEMTGTVDIDSERGLSFERYNPLENPAHYMPIAIEHEINIEFDRDSHKVSSHFWTKDFQTGFHHSGFFDKDQTGRAVCECFLLMDITL